MISDAGMLAARKECVLVSVHTLARTELVCSDPPVHQEYRSEKVLALIRYFIKKKLTYSIDRCQVYETVVCPTGISRL